MLISSMVKFLGPSFITWKSGRTQQTDSNCKPQTTTSPFSLFRNAAAAYREQADTVRDQRPKDVVARQQAALPSLGPSRQRSILAVRECALRLQGSFSQT